MEHVAVVSHDAGGAEILSSWLNRAQCKASLVVAGPATDIFKRKCYQPEFLPLEVALANCTWVLCGSGWQTSFERQAIALGRSLGKKTVAFVDHWVKYKERFEEAGHLVLPDEIWVGDIEAERIALTVFDKTPILLQSNPYVEDLLVQIAEFKASNPLISTGTGGAKVLYVCEPVSEHAASHFGNERHWGYTEHDALRFFLTNVVSLGQTIDRITIRPHPTEQKDKYYWALSLFSLPIEFGGQKTLLEEILESDTIVGCESMAMVVGLIAGKQVISSIPVGGRPCQLPHTGIVRMHLLVGSTELDV